jgi:hypothetical protein
MRPVISVQTAEARTQRAALTAAVESKMPHFRTVEKLARGAQKRASHLNFLIDRSMR